MVNDIAGEALYLGIMEKCLRSLVARGLIRYRRLGGRIVFLGDEIGEFLARSPA